MAWEFGSRVGISRLRWWVILGVDGWIFADKQGVIVINTVSSLGGPKYRG